MTDNLLILQNSPALHALKRPQLVNLCKRYGIKANGKNSDLIDRLKYQGQVLSQSDPSSDDEEEDEQAGENNENLDLSSGSTPWDIVQREEGVNPNPPGGDDSIAPPPSSPERVWRNLNADPFSGPPPPPDALPPPTTAPPPPPPTTSSNATEFGRPAHNRNDSRDSASRSSKSSAQSAFSSFKSKIIKKVKSAGSMTKSSSSNSISASNGGSIGGSIGVRGGPASIPVRSNNGLGLPAVASPPGDSIVSKQTTNSSSNEDDGGGDNQDDDDLPMDLEHQLEMNPNIPIWPPPTPQRQLEPGRERNDSDGDQEEEPGEELATPKRPTGNVQSAQTPLQASIRLLPSSCVPTGSQSRQASGMSSRGDHTTPSHFHFQVQSHSLPHSIFEDASPLRLPMVDPNRSPSASPRKTGNWQVNGSGRKIKPLPRKSVAGGSGTPGRPTIPPVPQLPDQYHADREDNTMDPATAMDLDVNKIPEKPNGMFVFGSPNNKNKPLTGPSTSASTSNLDHRSVIMAEMQRRIGSGIAPTIEGSEERKEESAMEWFTKWGLDGKGNGPSAEVLKKAAEAQGDKFDKLHQKEFEKMDSITNSYAAKRPAKRPLESGPSNHGSIQSRNTVTSTSAPTFKRFKSETGSIAASTAFSTASTSTKGKGKMRDMQILEGLKEEGWTGADEEERQRQKKLKLQKEKREKERRKKELERRRASRRESGLGTAGGSSIKRVGPRRSGGRPSLGRPMPPQKQGSATSRFFKSFKSFNSQPENSTVSFNAAKPALTTTSSVSASTKPSTTVNKSDNSLKQKKAVPPWKKFDLKASLQKPLGYAPKTGKLPEFEIKSGSILQNSNAPDTGVAANNDTAQTNKPPPPTRASTFAGSKPTPTRVMSGAPGAQRRVVSAATKQVAAASHNNNNGKPLPHAPSISTPGPSGASLAMRSGNEPTETNFTVGRNNENVMEADNELRPNPNTPRVRPARPGSKKRAVLAQHAGGPNSPSGKGRIVGTGGGGSKSTAMTPKKVGGKAVGPGKKVTSSVSRQKKDRDIGMGGKGVRIGGGGSPRKPHAVV